MCDFFLQNIWPYLWQNGWKILDQSVCTPYNLHHSTLQVSFSNLFDTNSYPPRLDEYQLLTYSEVSNMRQGRLTWLCMCLLDFGVIGWTLMDKDLLYSILILSWWIQRSYNFEDKIFKIKTKWAEPVFDKILDTSNKTYLELIIML